MVLAIDVGNSNIVLGGYEDDMLCFCARLSTSHHMEADQYAVQLAGIFSLYNVSAMAIEGIVISSVVPRITGRIVQAVAHFSNVEPLHLCLQDAGDMQILIDNPNELGMDILASAIAVRLKKPLPAVIIDMGTATKLSAVDANGNMPGVAIAPGLYVSLDGLVKGTSLLRSIPLEAPTVAIGKNTGQSMKSGIVLGTAAMLDGMIDRFEQELGPIKTIIATGGAAPVIVPHCKRNIEISDTLLLEGLYSAYCCR